MKRIVVGLVLLILPFSVANTEVFAIDPTGTTLTDPSSLSRSPEGLWSRISRTSREEVAHGPRAYRTYAVDEESLKVTLDAAPMEHTRSAGRVMSVPMPDGSYTRLSVQESPILSPELQSRHPEIRTYVARGVDEPSINGRLDHTPAGFHAMLFTPRGMMFVNPNEDGDRKFYRVYWKSDVVREPFQCGVTETAAPALAAMGIEAKSSGDRLRTYQLALNTTGEYTNFFGGETQALAAATTSVNRITGIYERELGIRMQLVYFHAFTDPSTDPYTDGNVLAMIDENQAELNARVTAGDLTSYDIGHVFGGRGRDGVVWGTTCDNSTKGRGATDDANPQGDAFDVDFAAHEIGHQFGGSHTWSGLDCGPPTQFVPSAAMEPGSGTTVMGYAGVCGGTPDEDIQPHSDPFFHTVNFDEMTTFRDSSSCGTWSDTGNLAPSVEAGDDCTVPQGTPFILSATGSDPNGDALTYAWEQFDAAPARVSGYPSPTATTGPLFRSQVPVLDGLRFLPDLDDLIADTVSPWEVLPGVDRTLHFRVTARDNRAGGGGVSYDSMQVNVSGAPFRITSPQQGDSVECGYPWTVTWDVGGGSIAGQVFVDLGIGPLTWNLGLVPNIGSFTMPIRTGDRTQVNKTAWIELIPNGNFCFFNLSKKFQFVDTTAPALTVPPPVTAECVSPSGTPVNIGAGTASDTCDDAVAVTNNAPPVFPLGTTDVLWTATDYSGNRATTTQGVTVHDTVPPTLTAPPAVTAECVSPSGTPVNIGTAAASDTCDDAVAVTNNAPPVFPLGTTDVLWTATDDSGNQTNDTQVVTVRDTLAPVISCNSPATILPRSAPISFTALSSDACYGPQPTTINNYDCYAYKKKKRVDKKDSCVVEFSGNTILILDSGGVGDNIEWTVVSVDGSGNSSTKTCHLVVVRQ